MTDIMSREKRSALMSRIRGKDTGIERTVAHALAVRGLHPERHSKDLPGRPDFVFREQRLAVFVDGDFWHGWRFPSWEHKLTLSGGTRSRRHEDATDETSCGCVGPGGGS